MDKVQEISNIKNQPTVFVIFGAGGDLSRKKLFPALFKLHTSNLLPQKFKIIATSRTKHSTKEFITKIKESINPQNRNWQKFASTIKFVASDVSQYESLSPVLARLKDFEKEIANCVKTIIYLAIAPSLYENAFENLGKSKLNLGCQIHGNKARVVIEKPFGRDFESAKKLNEKLKENFDSEQIFRIDHFLGKETVQNILTFRFGNEIFEPVWNRQYVDHVQITFTERIGIEKRGKFYEETGALRDIVQNHLLRLLTLVAMEEPKSLTHEDLRQRRIEVVNNIKIASAEEVVKNTVRAQYEGYRQEPDVDPKSQTETYTAVKLFIENDRWKDVPFYVRTGKKLTGDVESIIVSFKEKGHKVFENFWNKPLPNHITIQTKPSEGIGIRIAAKKPGFATVLGPVDMEFCYRTSFDTYQPSAYERLLMDVILGDQTLFLGEVGASWKFIDPIEDTWRKGKPQLATYKPGSWGPKEADELIAKDGRAWLAPILTICKIY